MFESIPPKEGRVFPGLFILSVLHRPFFASNPDRLFNDLHFAALSW